MRNSLLQHLGILAAIVLCLASTLPAKAALSAADQIKPVCDKTLTDPFQAHGIQGILVQSMDTGKVIYSHNNDVLMAPASNMKLIATSAALDLLGPDYKMTTSLYSSAKPTSKGEIKGDLVLVGHGDSYLQIADLQKMADQLKSMGIKSVKGNIVGDDTWFDDVRIGQGWQWEDEGLYDCCQPSALNVNENLIYVYVKPGAKVGDPAVVEVTPGNSYFKVVNECVTGEKGSRRSFGATRLHATNTIRVYGSIPLGFEPDSLCPETGYAYVQVYSWKAGESEPDPAAKLSVDNPTVWVCTIFKELLEKDGIKVKGKAVRGKVSQDATLLLSHDSKPLSELVHILLKPSDNFMSECLMKTLGKEVKGEGSWEAGRAVEYDWLKSIGVDLSEVNIADSSGQSRMDLITANALVQILTHIYQTKYYDTISNGLPIAGVDSHLRNRMLNTPAVNNVKAKTGYIPFVCSLSGYCKTLAGENMAVSVIQNNHRCSLDEAYVMQDDIFSAVSKITVRTDADTNGKEVKK